MKIVVNTRLIHKDHLDGIGWFSYSSLKKIVKDHPEVDFYFIYNYKSDFDLFPEKNVHPVYFFPPARHAFLNIIWFEWHLKRLLNKIKPDLFLSPDGNLCLGWKGKQLAVIHDLNFHHQPKGLGFFDRHYYNFFYPKYAEAATRIATVSNYSKKDIEDAYSVSPDRIDVVYNGINDFYAPIPQAQQLDVRDQFTQGKPYFVFIGSLTPRKNIQGLMRAYDIYRKKYPSDVQLIIIGGGLYQAKEIQQLKNELEFGNQIQFIGRLSGELLNEVLSSAIALVFVPFFEGFGIPLIEAMQCGTPVIASNTSCVPEIAGEAALYVDPHNADQIADAMNLIHQDAALSESLIQKGFVRKNTYSWEKTAALLWESMMKAISS